MEAETFGPSLAKMKRKDKFPLIFDPKYSWVLNEFASYPSDLTSREKVGEFVSSFIICLKLMGEFIAVKPCGKSYRVFTKPF